jgi:hypothetical protein
LTTHLLPELPTSFDEETEDEQSSRSEPNSAEETISQKGQVVDSTLRKSIDDAKEEWTELNDRISSDQIETK